MSSARELENRYFDPLSSYSNTKEVNGITVKISRFHGSPEPGFEINIPFCRTRIARIFGKDERGPASADILVTSKDIKDNKTSEFIIARHYFLILCDLAEGFDEDDTLKNAKYSEIAEIVTFCADAAPIQEKATCVHDTLVSADIPEIVGSKFKKIQIERGNERNNILLGKDDNDSYRYTIIATGDENLEIKARNEVELFAVTVKLLQDSSDDVDNRDLTSAVQKYVEEVANREVERFDEYNI